MMILEKIHFFYVPFSYVKKTRIFLEPADLLLHRRSWIFRPSISLPFIDADSVSSLVGNDELWKEKRLKQEENPKHEQTNNHTNARRIFEEDRQMTLSMNRSIETIELVQQMIKEEMVSHSQNIVELSKIKVLNCPYWSWQFRPKIFQKPNGEIKVEICAEEVTVPLIAVSRVESIRRLGGRSFTTCKI